MRKQKIRRRTGKLNKCMEEIRDILLLPYLDVTGSLDLPLDNCDKLHMAFAEGQREIWRRKVLKNLRLTGMWWTDGGEKYFTTRRIKGGHRECLYVREDFREEEIDLEVLCNVKTNWRKGKFKSKWLTVTVTPEEYEKLSEHLGEREDLCKILKHKRTGRKND